MIQLFKRDGLSCPLTGARFDTDGPGEVASGLGQLVERVLLLRASERFLLPRQTRSGVTYRMACLGTAQGT